MNSSKKWIAAAEATTTAEETNFHFADAAVIAFSEKHISEDEVEDKEVIKNVQWKSN